MEGFVPLYRKILTWEWYDEANTYRLFMHILLTVNHKQGKWRGIEIPAGSRITSQEKLAIELKLSKQNIRTALKNLQSTNEITIKTTNNYTMINVVKWAEYNFGDSEPNTPNNKQNNTQSTFNQHTANTLLTTNNNDNNGNNDKNEKKKEEKISHVTRNVTDNVSKKVIDESFDEVWSLYPRKEGKGKIKDTKRKDIHKNKDEYKRCVERYKNQIEKERTDKKFIQHGSTFFNSGYVDFLDKNYQEEETPKHNHNGVVL